ncbi:hypothetical protein CHARACLAT_030728 [Characodon lateralis]|uniref:Uncharacterized protein n=1 Tax=Characodon lateralis TaxID=208331 RepID=A0ABU7DL67_9TELE|nr:hypothetical protein [Characodon lateralis]
MSKKPSPFLVAKASATRLEEQFADCESALVEEKTASLERKHETKQYQYQVAELKAEIQSLRIKYANLLLETERTREGKEMEVEKVFPPLHFNPFYQLMTNSWFKQKFKHNSCTFSSIFTSTALCFLLIVNLSSCH